MDRGIQTGDPSRGDMRGLRDILDRIRDRRRELLKEGQLSDPLADIRERLEEIVEASGPACSGGWTRRSPGSSREWQDGATADGRPTTPGPQLQRMLRGIAAKRLDSLDALPPDVGSRIRALQDYDFIDGDARQAFESCSTSSAGACSTG